MNFVDTGASPGYAWRDFWVEGYMRSINFKGDFLKATYIGNMPMRRVVDDVQVTVIAADNLGLFAGAQQADNEARFNGTLVPPLRYSYSDDKNGKWSWTMDPDWCQGVHQCMEAQGTVYPLDLVNNISVTDISFNVYRMKYGAAWDLYSSGTWTQNPIFSEVWGRR